MSKAKILVFIPAYRCAPQIVRVLEQFSPSLQQLIDTVVVVDNQSPDDTMQRAIEFGQNKITQCRFIVWRNQHNYGLGGSHKAAFQYAFAHGFDYLVVLHGDDQAHLADAESLLTSLSTKAIDQQDVDCYLGARFAAGSRLQGYSGFRTFGNLVYNLLFSVSAGHRIYDLGSGLNIYKLANLRSFYFKQFPDDLTFNYVMLLASYHRQQNVKFFPISWRETDQRSNVKLFQQAFRVLRLLMSFTINKSQFLASEWRAKAFDSYQGDIQFDSARAAAQQAPNSQPSSQLSSEHSGERA